MKISAHRNEKGELIERHIKVLEDSDLGNFAIADIVNGDVVEGPVYFDWVEAEKVELFLRHERLNADARDAEYEVPA